MIEKTDVKDGVAERCLDSWRDFHRLNEEIFCKASAYVYRGQAHDWPLLSLLDRLKTRWPRRKNLGGGIPEYFEAAPVPDSTHLEAFKQLARTHLPKEPVNDDEWWALAQHHGLATPLLDWTRFPYVALFFAFEEECAVVSGENGSRSFIAPDHRMVYAYSTAMHPSREQSDPDSVPDSVSVVYPSGDGSKRAISQGAVFVKMPSGEKKLLPDNDLDSWVRNEFGGRNQDAVLTKYKIRATEEERHNCLAALNKMNIHRASLFPDVDGAAAYVNSLWQPGHEDLIGWEAELEGSA